MDNMATAVTKEKGVLEQLVATNAKQASTIATQVTTILELSDELNQLQLRIINKGGRGGRVVNSGNVRKFLKDVYF